LIKLKLNIQIKLANAAQQAYQAEANMANSLGNLINGIAPEKAYKLIPAQRAHLANAQKCQNDYDNLNNELIPRAQRKADKLAANVMRLKNLCAQNGIPNVSGIQQEAEEECKGAIMVIVDITAIIETTVNTTTQYKTEGEVGEGEAEVVATESEVNGVTSSTEACTAFLGFRQC